MKPLDVNRYPLNARTDSFSAINEAVGMRNAD